MKMEECNGFFEVSQTIQPELSFIAILMKVAGQGYNRHHNRGPFKVKPYKVLQILLTLTRLLRIHGVHLNIDVHDCTPVVQDQVDNG